MLKNSKVVFICQLVRPESFGPYYVLESTRGRSVGTLILKLVTRVRGGQLHAPAVLFMCKEPSVPAEEYAGWRAEDVLTLLRQGNFLSLPRIEPLFIGLPGPQLSHYTNSTVKNRTTFMIDIKCRISDPCTSSLWVFQSTVSVLSINFLQQ